MTNVQTSKRQNVKNGRGCATNHRPPIWLFLVTSVFLSVLCISAVRFTFAQSQSIVHSPHNLSASGPGAIRATGEEQVCIFCHAPHGASHIQPLWNRYQPASVYQVYTSSSLQSEPGQPTGSSKMCLSCHDGTIAIGSVVSRGQPIHMAGGVTVMPRGARGNLGTDLSDDHPISFRFDTSLAMRNTKLADPRSLPQSLRLDHNRELQCTTCHDPHNNMHGNFLTMSNENSAMCRSCHTISTTSIPEHTDCASCHQPHSAPSGPHLLRGDRVSSTCLSCHDGSNPRAINIAADLRKLSSHDDIRPSNRVPRVDASAGVRRLSAAGTGGASMSGHAGVSCADCHDPHTMHPGGFAIRFAGSKSASTATAPYIQPSLGAVSGVSTTGAPLQTARTEYEVCYKCHADHNVVASPTIPRQIAQTNMRLMFDASAVSAHPVQNVGRGSHVPSLRPEWRDGHMLYCSDCHGSDTGRRAGGTGPDGVHGSNHAGLLIARYETADFTVESPHAYALCYTCHERDGADGVLSDRSFRFHRLHVVDHRTPCSACHDSHGISSAQGSRMNHSNLINFDLSIVSPDPVTGRLEYRSTGVFSGSCALSCHGVAHSPKEY